MPRVPEKINVKVRKLCTYMATKVPANANNPVERTKIRGWYRWTIEAPIGIHSIVMKMIIGNPSRALAWLVLPLASGYSLLK